MSALSDYAFINAKLRAQIGNLLSLDTYMNIARARSLVEAVAVLRETPLANAERAFAATGDVSMLEAELNGMQYALFSCVAAHLATHAGGAAAAFTAHVVYRLELAAVKNAVRLWFERVVRRGYVEDKLPYLLRGPAAAAARVERIVNAERIEQVAAAIENAHLASALSDNAARIAERGSLFPFEAACDRWYFGELRALAAELSLLDRNAVSPIVALEIDAMNVNWTVRLREYYRFSEAEAMELLVPGGRYFDRQRLSAGLRSAHPAQALLAEIGAQFGGSLSGVEHYAEGDHTHGLVFLESALRDLLLRRSRRLLGGYPFTVGTIVAFMALKQHETRTLITVLQAKSYNYTAERIGALI